MDLKDKERAAVKRAQEYARSHGCRCQFYSQLDVHSPSNDLQWPVRRSLDLDCPVHGQFEQLVFVAGSCTICVTRQTHPYKGFSAFVTSHRSHWSLPGKVRSRYTWTEDCGGWFSTLLNTGQLVEILGTIFEAVDWGNDPENCFVYLPKSYGGNFSLWPDLRQSIGVWLTREQIAHQLSAYEPGAVTSDVLENIDLLVIAWYCISRGLDELDVFEIVRAD